jgi:hypothetical protein
VVERLKLCSCKSGWDKSYKTTDKSSTKVRSTTETSSEKPTKGIKYIKERRKERREETLPSSPISWKKEVKKPVRIDIMSVR